MVECRNPYYIILMLATLFGCICRQEINAKAESKPNMSSVGVHCTYVLTFVDMGRTIKIL